MTRRKLQLPEAYVLLPEQKHVSFFPEKNVCTVAARNISLLLAFLLKLETLEAGKIMTETDSTKKWTLLRKFEESQTAHTGRSGIENEQGKVTMIESELAEIHATRLEQTHTHPTDIAFNNEWEDTVNKEITLQKHSLEPNFTLEDATEEVIISPKEIEEILRKKSNKSSGGQDGITYKKLKQGGKNMFKFLATLFTLIFATGYFPESWKIAHVTMLPKPGKDPKKAASYRPISLTSCLSKLYESIIRLKLEKKLSRIKEENIFQAGYKKNRSAQEHILRLVEDIHIGFMKRECTLAVFLDVEGAFDKVWINGLIYKLMNIGLNNLYLRPVVSFLTNRVLRVKVNENLSRQIKMGAGTPQGCCLSPTLFNLMVDDLKDKLNGRVKLAQYADDIAIWATSKCQKKAEYDIQYALSAISKWTNKWRIKLAPHKTNYMLFTKCPTHREIRTTLNINGTNIKETKQAHFLGVLFEQSLSWKPYKEELLSRVRHKSYILKKLAAKDRWKHPETMHKLYKAIILPVFEFGAIFIAPSKPDFWTALTKSHGECLKSFAGIPSKASYERTCDAMFTESITEDLRLRARKRLINLLIDSPFGDELLEKQSITTNTTNHYINPIRFLLSNEEREEIRVYRRSRD